MNEDIHLIINPITLAELKLIAEERWGGMVKAVVDIEQNKMAVGGEMHADEEAFLLEQNSKQENLWGINLYPDKIEEQFVEFDSMINLRPRQGNRSRSVDDPALRQRIREVVKKLVV